MSRGSGGGARKPLVAGNWKMHKNHLEAIALTQKLAFSLTGKDFDRADVAILPPFTALRSVQTMVDGDKLRLGYGAQDISPFDEGAYTGEISGAMLAKLGCDFVLAGHSERRQHQGESDELVNAKIRAALRAGITPVLCVGEPLPVRQDGKQVSHVLAQLEAGLDRVTGAQVAGMVVAYEPVWAIGTGEVATPPDAQEVCAAVRASISGHHGGAAAAGVRILYGGSVKTGNMAAIMAQPDVDGALVGGASLEAGEFVGICRYHEQPV